MRDLRPGLIALLALACATTTACGVSGDPPGGADVGESDQAAVADVGTLAFVSPRAGATIAGRVTLAVTPPSGTYRVYYFVDDAWHATATAGPSWTSALDAARLANGRHELRAGAFDRSNRLLARKTIAVYVGTTAPADAGTDAATGSDSGTPRPDSGAPTPDSGTADSGTPTGVQPVIPRPTGACPNFAEGRLRFQPAGIPARDAQIYMGPEARTMHGPVIFWWHGNEETSPVNGVRYAFGDAGVAAIKAIGGIVIGAYKDPANPNAWYALSGDRDDDLRYADEVLACAHQQVGIDPRRVHSAGMSAGGIHTTRMSYLRSSYLASVVVMSGGLMRGAPAMQQPANRFPALIYYGGANDLPGVGIVDAVFRYRDDLDARGHFNILCNHGRGHVIPTDAQTSTRRFLLDHPWGVRPEPYAAGVPSGFVSYCEL